MEHDQNETANGTCSGARRMIEKRKTWPLSQASAADVVGIDGRWSRISNLWATSSSIPQLQPVRVLRVINL